MILTFGWVQRVASLASVPTTAPPGNCTPSRHEWLETLKYFACKAAEGRCKGNMPPALLAVKVVAKEACLAARLDVLIECFGGADPNHKIPVDQLVTEIKNCLKFQK